MGEGEELARLLEDPALPPGFERWRVEVGVGETRSTSAAEWAGAMVLVESGQLEVECLAGGSRIFSEGDLLVLGWLPLSRLRNVGSVAVSLLCIRRPGQRVSEGLIRVSRARIAR